MTCLLSDSFAWNLLFISERFKDISLYSWRSSTSLCGTLAYCPSSCLLLVSLLWCEGSCCLMILGNFSSSFLKPCFSCRLSCHPHQVYWKACVTPYQSPCHPKVVPRMLLHHSKWKIRMQHKYLSSSAGLIKSHQMTHYIFHRLE